MFTSGLPLFGCKFTHKHVLIEAKALVTPLKLFLETEGGKNFLHQPLET